MRAERFRELLTTKGPFASIYIDDSHDTEDAAAQLELKWRHARDQLEDRGADASLVSAAERALLDARPPVGRSGRALVVGADGVLLNLHLTHPPAESVVRMSELPYLMPAVELADDRPTYVVVAVDHAGADFVVHRAGMVRAETVEGEGYPVHHAHSADSSGYGDPQRTADSARAANIRTVAERLTTLVDETGARVVLIRGEVRSRSDLLADLPPRVAEIAVELSVGARNDGHDDADVRAAVDEVFANQHAAASDDVAQRFSAEISRPSGLAVQGLPGVCAALRDGAVDTLIVGDLGEATVVADDEIAVVAPNADVLSEWGAAAARTLPADEALPYRAVAIDAAVVRADERISPDDGVAALLRYVPASLHRE